MKEEKDLFGVCPYVTAQRIFSGKWAILIIHNLAERTHRFGELQRALPEVTQATLTRQLRELEHHGLVHREVYSEVPPRVEYSLTPLGREFIPVLEQFQVFGDKYIQYLHENAS